MSRPLFDLVLDRIRNAAGGATPGTRPVADDPAPIALALPWWPPEPTPPSAVPAANLAEMAVALRREAGSPCVELTVAPEVGVRVSRAQNGIALLVEASPQAGAHADAELARLIGALRARGITVATASVRAVRGAGQPAPAGRRAR